MGRLFAYGAVARSGRLIEEWNHDKTTPYIKEFTSLLISLASKKRYLQEPAISIILELVEKVPDLLFPSKVKFGFSKATFVLHVFAISHVEVGKVLYIN